MSEGPVVIMIGFFSQKQLGMIGLAFVTALHFTYLIADVLHYSFVKHNRVRRFGKFRVFRNR